MKLEGINNDVIKVTVSRKEDQFLVDLPRIYLSMPCHDAPIHLQQNAKTDFKGLTKYNTLQLWEMQK